MISSQTVSFQRADDTSPCCRSESDSVTTNHQTALAASFEPGDKGSTRVPIQGLSRARLSLAVRRTSERSRLEGSRCPSKQGSVQSVQDCRSVFSGASSFGVFRKRRRMLPRLAVARVVRQLARANAGVLAAGYATATPGSQDGTLVKAKKINYERIGIVGVPFDKGQRKKGVGLGPKAIREAGLIDHIQEISPTLDIKDYGDIQYEALNFNGRKVGNMKKLEHVASCSRNLSHQVTEVLDDDRLCITLGGDHAIAIGSIDGHLHHSKDVAVIWVDAHADLNTNSTSPSGNIHGMPVALLAKELCDYWPYIPGMDWQEPIISIKNLAYIGLRSVDPYERAIIEKFGINAFGMREVEKYGIREVMRMALERIDPEGTRSLHVSYDIDSLDVLEAPSTGTSVRGGLTLREGIYIMEEAYGTGRLAAVDLVEVNPAIGTPEDVRRTVEAAVHLLVAACGHSRKGDIADTLDLLRSK